VTRNQPTRKQPAQLGQSQTPSWVKMVVGLLIAALVIGGAVALFANNDDSGNDSGVSAGAGSTVPSTAPAVASAKGKPCVAMAGTPPAGAPTVPVQIGPPPTQLVKQDLQEGSGTTVAEGATVTVDYIGVSCSTGKIFDTSYGKQPATFPLANVIPGWQQGIPGMKVGGTRLLGIPAELAYGSQGYPPDIAPDETLWFVVKLNDVQAG
jgi:hypothetical protein